MSDETAITIYTGGDQALTIPIETPDYSEIIPSLEQALEDWMTESSRSGGVRTPAIYRQTITQFRAHLLAKGLDLDSSPVAVAAVAREWLNARPVSWATFNHRRSILSSWFKYALRNEIADIETNPIERIEPRKAGEKAQAAIALPHSQVKAALARIDRSTVLGLRDYALLSVALTTGMRASELAAMRLSHLRYDGGHYTLIWPRRKGNEPMEPSILPAKTSRVLYTYLSDEQVYGNRLLTTPGHKPIWLSFSDRNFKQSIGTRTISNICKEVLGDGRVHVTRHTAAVTLAHQKDVTLEQVRKFLGHKNAKTTSDYLKEKQTSENQYGDQMEADFGIETEQ
jgi:integrase